MDGEEHGNATPDRGTPAEAAGNESGKILKYLLIGVAALAAILILVAGIFIVALVSIALLGFFPGMASDAKMTQSAAYWKEAKPFAILEYTITGSTGAGSVVLQNVDASGTMTLTQLSAGGAAYSGREEFAPGETKQISLSGLPPGASGSAYDLPVEIAYETPNGVLGKQHGAKNLVGKYS